MRKAAESSAETVLLLRRGKVIGLLLQWIA